MGDAVRNILEGMRTASRDSFSIPDMNPQTYDTDHTLDLFLISRLNSLEGLSILLFKD
jgi:hypothetical protein